MTDNQSQPTVNVSDLSELFDRRLRRTENIDYSCVSVLLKKAIVTVLLRSIIIDPRWVCFHPETPTNISLLASQADPRLGELGLAAIAQLCQEISYVNSAYDIERIIETMVHGTDTYIKPSHLKSMVEGAITSAMVATTVTVVNDSIQALLDIIDSAIIDDDQLIAAPDKPPFEET
jgi:hypothetical protein